MAQIDDLQTTFNNEIFRRSVFLTNAIVSYDDNPNLGGAPAILQSAPLGTWFYEETANLWWRKISSGATDWREQAGGADGVTDQLAEAVVISVDPIGGDDTETGIYVTQADYDDRGAFATVPAAVNSLPTNLIYNVTISLVDGNHTIGLDGLGNLSRFKFTIRDMSDTDLGFTALTFASANGLVRVSGTSLMSVQSATTRQVTLTADPGFSVDQYQSFWMRIVSGTGAGQIAPIRSHATTVFETVPTWSPVPDGTSQVEIVSPAAILDLPAPSRFSTYGRSGLGLPVQPTIRFSAVDLQPVSLNSFIAFNDSSVYLIDGTRLVNTTIAMSSGFLLLGDCIIDAANGTFSPFGGCVFLTAAFLRSKNTGEKRLLINSAGPGIAYQESTDPAGSCTGIWLFRVAIDDCVDGIEFDGPGVLKLNIDVISQNNTGHGVVLKRAALVTTDTSFADELTGATNDFEIDGVSRSWAQLAAVPDKAMIGPHQSFIQKDV